MNRRDFFVSATGVALFPVLPALEKLDEYSVPNGTFMWWDNDTIIGEYNMNSDEKELVRLMEKAFAKCAEYDPADLIVVPYGS